MSGASAYPDRSSAQALMLLLIVARCSSQPVKKALEKNHRLDRAIEMMSGDEEMRWQCLDVTCFFPLERFAS